MSDVAAWMPVILKGIELATELSKSRGVGGKPMTPAEAITKLERIKTEIKRWPVRDAGDGNVDTDAHGEIETDIETDDGG